MLLEPVSSLRLQTSGERGAVDGLDRVELAELD